MSTSVKQPRKREPLVPAALLVGLVLAVILILGIGFLGWTNKQGFLGTYAPIIADVNLIAQIVLLGLLIAGLIDDKTKEKHRAPLSTDRRGALQRGSDNLHHGRPIFPAILPRSIWLAIDRSRHSRTGSDRLWYLPHAAHGEPPAKTLADEEMEAADARELGSFPARYPGRFCDLLENVHPVNSSPDAETGLTAGC